MICRRSCNICITVLWLRIIVIKLLFRPPSVSPLSNAFSSLSAFRFALGLSSFPLALHSSGNRSCNLQSDIEIRFADTFRYYGGVWNRLSGTEGERARGTLRSFLPYATRLCTTFRTGWGTSGLKVFLTAHATEGCKMWFSKYGSQFRCFGRQRNIWQAFQMINLTQFFVIGLLARLFVPAESWMENIHSAFEM